MNHGYTNITTTTTNGTAEALFSKSQPKLPQMVLVIYLAEVNVLESRIDDKNPSHQTSEQREEREKTVEQDERVGKRKCKRKKTTTSEKCGP